MLTFDFECTNLDYGSALNPSNRILMVCWKEDKGPVRSHVGDIMQATEFFDALSRHKVLCAYNAKFEMLWMKRIGLDPGKYAWHDPMLAEKVLLGNVRKPLSLGKVCQRYGLSTKDPLIDGLMQAGVCPSDMPQKPLLARCKLDVQTTAQLMQLTLGRLQEGGQVEVYRTRCNLTPVLAEMESNGMFLSELLVYAEYANFSAELGKLDKELDAMTGGINMRSSDQLAEYLYDQLKFPEKKNKYGRPLRNKKSKRWPDGKPKTDAATMQWLSKQATTEEQKKFIELKMRHAKVASALSKNLEFFHGVCLERGGWFYGQFNQTVAATHRLTSSGVPITFEKTGKTSSVQFQNMPREFKRLFRAPKPDDEGSYKIVEADASQLEFRVAAYLGQDKQAMADIADPDFDAHCRTASVMFDIPYANFLAEYRNGNKQHKHMRQEAKADTFKPLYGGTTGTPEQEKYYKSFAERYRGVANQQETWLAEVISSNGNLDMPWGMKFHWEISERNGQWFDKRTFRPVAPQVCNYPVQNLATAEIVPMAIVSLWRKVKNEKLRVIFVNTVHDSVIAYVHEDDLDRYAELCGEAFTTDVYEELYTRYGLEFNVPLGCEVEAGTHWGETERSWIFDDVSKWRSEDE